MEHEQKLQSAVDAQMQPKMVPLRKSASIPESTYTSGSEDDGTEVTFESVMNSKKRPNSSKKASLKKATPGEFMGATFLGTTFGCLLGGPFGAAVVGGASAMAVNSRSPAGSIVRKAGDAVAKPVRNRIPVEKQQELKMKSTQILGKARKGLKGLEEKIRIQKQREVQKEVDAWIDRLPCCGAQERFQPVDEATDLDLDVHSVQTEPSAERRKTPGIEIPAVPKAEESRRMMV